MVVGIKIDHITGEVEELESEEIVQDILEAFVRLIAGPMFMHTEKQKKEVIQKNGETTNSEREVCSNEY